MAKKDLLERAFVKAIEKIPLTLDETGALHECTGEELLEMGSLAEAAFARNWCRGQIYRWRAQLQQMPPSKRDNLYQNVKGWFPFYD